MTHRPLFLLAAVAAGSLIALASIPAQANDGMRVNKRPALVITNKPNPGVSSHGMMSNMAVMNAPARTTPMNVTPASRPYRTPDITAAQLTGGAYYDGQTTMAGRKINELMGDLGGLQSLVVALDSRLSEIERRNDGQAAEYYAAIATINTQLQAGTTPGNPRLVQRLETAQGVLDTLAQNIADLNGMAVQIADAASRAAFLMSTIQTTYALSGAVEEDHQKLAGMEQSVNQEIATIDRLLNSVNDSITRAAAYLSTERSNLRTLALAVSKGDLYGRSLSNNPFAAAAATGGMQPASFGGAAGMGAATGPSGRPLVKIKFDKPSVQYEQPVYMAVSDAMQKYPDARFEIVAVHPTGGNPAQVAIESTRARRNAEQVLRTLTQMGLDGSRIDIGYAPSDSAATSEVHVNIR